MKIIFRLVSILCAVALTMICVPFAAATSASASTPSIQVQGTTSISGYMIEGVTFEIAPSPSDVVVVRLLVLRDGEWVPQVDRTSLSSGALPHRGSFAAEDVAPLSQKPGSYSFRIGYCAVPGTESGPNNKCDSAYVWSAVDQVRVLPRKSTRPVFRATKSQPKGKRIMQFRTWVPDAKMTVKQRGKTVTHDQWTPGVFKVKLPSKIRRGQLIIVKVGLRGGTVTKRYRAAY